MNKIISYVKEHKLVVFVMLIIIIILSYEWYIANAKRSIDFDTNTYAVLLEWIWKVHREWDSFVLNESNNKKQLFSWDRVSTLWDNSLLLIEWGDWSISRLWWNSSVLINVNNVSSDFTDIEIDFTLEKWKSWSNVVTAMDENSYFNQRFESYVAWVRWTVYEINLDESYIYVDDHEVLLKDAWKAKKHKIRAWQTFSINLLEYIEWEARNLIRAQLNKRLDKEYIRELAKEIQAYFENASKIPASILVYFDEKKKYTRDVLVWNISNILEYKDSSKELIYDSIYGIYQKTNFLKPWDYWFNTKSNLRSALIAIDYDKSQFLEKTIYYDIEHALMNNNDSTAQDLMTFLKNNSKSYKNLTEFFSNSYIINWSAKEKINIFVEEFNSLFDESGRRLDLNKVYDAKNNLRDKFIEWIFN